MSGTMTKSLMAAIVLASSLATSACAVRVHDGYGYRRNHYSHTYREYPRTHYRYERRHYDHDDNDWRWRRDRHDDDYRYRR
jgi:hypothetical protein